MHIEGGNDSSGNSHCVKHAKYKKAINIFPSSILLLLKTKNHPHKSKKFPANSFSVKPTDFYFFNQ